MMEQAPEVVKAECRYSTPVDVYSYGMTLMAICCRVYRGEEESIEQALKRFNDQLARRPRLWFLDELGAYPRAGKI